MIPMILRPLSRPHRQLLVAFSSRRAASTKTVQLATRTRIQSVQPAKWRHLPVSNRRGLATHPTGFEGHKVPKLIHGDIFEEHGVDDLLSPEGFSLAWTQYQSMILEKLNSMIYGTASSTNLPLWLSFQYAHDPGNASLFNHASMAVNNHFFFKSLSPKKTEPTTPFLRDIEDSFSSYDTLRTEMIETADAMFGPGFVWIVKDNEQGRMKILCTYLAGSPYPQAHPRVQKVDMATSRPSARPRYENQQPSNGVGSFGNYTYQGMVSSKRAQNGFIAFPILCVNTWEHMYLRDHGIHGKRAYLEAWWERIDWAVVESEAKQIKESSSGFDNVLRSQNFSAPGYRSRIR